jgi:thioredoxin reductase (NADPH)
VLEVVRWRRNGAQTRRPIRHVFNFIGADPNTDWLASSGLVLDKKGFITTGGGSRGPLETGEPGVFAIGDVRSGSTKRVAAGEGAQAMAALYAYLADARA